MLIKHVQKEQINICKAVIAFYSGLNLVRF